MTITAKSALGWILIIVGLLIIFWDIFVSYNYFTAKLEFPHVFAEPVVQTSEKDSSQQLDPEAMVGNIIKDQLNQTIGEGSITLILNMTAWILFASFLVYAGGRITGLGNDLLKS